VRFQKLGSPNFRASITLQGKKEVAYNPSWGATPWVRKHGGIVKVIRRRKLIKRAGSCYLCIPARIIKALEWKQGNFLKICRNGDGGLSIYSEDHTDDLSCSTKTEEALNKNLFTSA